MKNRKNAILKYPDTTTMISIVQVIRANNSFFLFSSLFLDRYTHQNPTVSGRHMMDPVNLKTCFLLITDVLVFCKRT